MERRPHACQNDKAKEIENEREIATAALLFRSQPT